MKPFATVRVVVLSALAVLSIVILGLAADLSGSHGTLDVGDVLGGSLGGLLPLSMPIIRVLSTDVANLAIATSVITLVFVVPLLIFKRLEKRSEWQKFVTLVWVELFWVTVLWFLWVVTAAKTEVFNLGSIFDSSLAPGLGGIIDCGSPCAEGRALKGLAWLTWLIVLGYAVALGACTFVSLRRGEGSFTHMVVDEVLSPNDSTPVGPPVLEDVKEKA